MAKRGAFKDSEFLKTMRRRFKLVNDAEAAQDERERDDIAFEDGEQWPADIQLARQGQSAVSGMPAVPARPTLVFNKVKEPVRQILNQERQADIGIQITPADDFGDLGITPDDTEVLLREGLVRRIQRASHAADARTWAYKRAVIAGRGYYIVRTRFLPGLTDDQEIYVDRIFNQAGVRLDPASEKPDGSDAEWEFIGTWMPWDKFKAEYPKDIDGTNNPFTECSDAEFMGLMEEYPDWYKNEDEARAVRIVDYWYVERTHQDTATLPDGRVVVADQVPEGVTPLRTRTIVEKTIKFCKVAGGVMKLEETEESGPDMPIVKVIGDEVLPYDHERRYVGMVRPARGANQGFNYMASKFVEAVGLSPIPTITLDPNAIEGYEEWWKAINTRALPYGPSRTWDDTGRQLNQPNRMPGDPNVGPLAQGIALFDGLVQTTTTVPDVAMGNTDPSIKSGKLHDAITSAASISTSNFLDNLKRAMEYEAQIINGKLHTIYSARPGRLVRIMTGEGQDQTMAVGAPPAQQAGMQQKAMKVAKLTKDANFNIIAKLTQNSENRRAQFIQTYGSMIAADPVQMTIGGDLFWEDSDMPHSRQLAKRQKAVLDPRVLAAIAAEESGGAPPDPKVAQLEQQLQQMQQELQQAQSGMAETQMKVQADQQVAQMKGQLDMQLAQMKIEVDAKIAEMQNQRDIQLAIIDRETRLQIAGQEINQKREEVAIDAQTKQADALLRDQGSVRDTLAGLQDSDASRAHDREQAERQAMLPQESE